MGVKDMAYNDGCVVIRDHRWVCAERGLFFILEYIDVMILFLV